MPVNQTRKQLMAMYRALFKAYGPQHWCPAIPLSKSCRAVLTQNTAWVNVEKAIKNLKRERLPFAGRLRDVVPRRLALLIRPSGHFNIKADRPGHLMTFLTRPLRREPCPDAA